MYLNRWGSWFFGAISQGQVVPVFFPPDSQECGSFQGGECGQRRRTCAVKHSNSVTYITGDFPFVLTSLSWAASAMQAFKNTDSNRLSRGGGVGGVENGEKRKSRAVANSICITCWASDPLIHTL